MFSHNIQTEIIAEGFRDKICDTEIVAALVHALGDMYYDVRKRAVKFFTITMTQGALSCFHGIFIL